MTRQAQNCIDLFKGQSRSSILEALNFLRSSVVQELMEFFNAKDKNDLARILEEL